MASITSVISVVVLLLVTYSYSIPVFHTSEFSTPDYEFTTGQTIVSHENIVNMQLVNEDESTVVPTIQTPRSFNSFMNHEVTTEGFDRPSRTFEDSSFFMTSTPAFPSKDEPSVDTRGFNHVFPTMVESSTEFDRRAIRPTESQEEVESSTEFESSTPVIFEHEMEETTEVEPSSSAQSFGKFTGLLHDDQSNETITTPEYDQTTEESTTEESTTRFPYKTQRLTKTVSYIPGKITETKIYSNAPSQTFVVGQRYGQNQLSQVQKQPIVNKEESDNWNESWSG